MPIQHTTVHTMTPEGKLHFIWNVIITPSIWEWGSMYSTYWSKQKVHTYWKELHLVHKNQEHADKCPHMSVTSRLWVASVGCHNTYMSYHRPSCHYNENTDTGKNDLIVGTSAASYAHFLVDCHYWYWNCWTFNDLKVYLNQHFI